jgi:hypothetical protein
MQILCQSSPVSRNGHNPFIFRRNRLWGRRGKGGCFQIFGKTFQKTGKPIFSMAHEIHESHGKGYSHDLEGSVVGWLPTAVGRSTARLHRPLQEPAGHQRPWVETPRSAARAIGGRWPHRCPSVARQRRSLGCRWAVFPPMSIGGKAFSANLPSRVKKSFSIFHFPLAILHLSLKREDSPSFFQ